jgi:hypothetical protein
MAAASFATPENIRMGVDLAKTALPLVFIVPLMIICVILLIVGIAVAASEAKPDKTTGEKSSMMPGIILMLIGGAGLLGAGFILFRSVSAAKAAKAAQAAQGAPAAYYPPPPSYYPPQQPFYR